MTSQGRSSTKLFGHLLRRELCQPWLWCGMLGALTIGFAAAPASSGGLAVMVLGLALVLLPAKQMQLTPWFSDMAFWRTRPISRKMMFAVRSVGLLIACVLPVVLVSAIGVHALGNPTSGAIFALVLLGSLGVVAASAAASAIGSRGGAWAGLSWQAITTVPIISTLVLLKLRTLFSLPEPAGNSGFVSGLIVSATVLAVGALLAWWIAGCLGRPKSALLVLLVTALALPWIGGTFRGDFFPSQPREEVLAIVDGESMLSLPVRVEGLAPDEWFVPSEIVVEGPEAFFSKSDAGGGAHSPLLDDAQVEVFRRDHRDFAVMVDVDRAWMRLRESLPDHRHWVPSEPMGRPLASNFRLPDRSLLDTPGERLGLSGSRYRVRVLGPFQPEMGRVRSNLSDSIEYRGAGVPNDHAIDIRIKIRRQLLGVSNPSWNLAQIAPPEVWGVLYHSKTGTAYGTVGRRNGFNRTSMASLFVRKTDLLLRFELPRLESALLGLDPAKVLSESELYLFAFDEAGKAVAR